MAYPIEVKLFALSERAEGKGWQIIRQRITERFNLLPPTVRAMEKWKKSINREGIAAELARAVGQTPPRTSEDAQKEIAQSLISALLSVRSGNEGQEDMVWTWFFQWAEVQLGQDRFKQMVCDYLSLSQRGE